MARRYDRSFLPQVLDDLRSLAEFDDRLIDAALQAITDIAESRKTGKLLGARYVSGDLTGCQRLRFDLAGERPERFRIIFRLLPVGPTPNTVEVIAIGPRGGHAAYQAAVARLSPS